MDFAIFRRKFDEFLPELTCARKKKKKKKIAGISQKWSGNDKLSRGFEKNAIKIRKN